MGQAILELENLSKSFAHFQFGPVDAVAEYGTSIALVGKNGSGKSTLFRLVLSLFSPDQGNIRLFGLNLAQHEREIKEKIGYAGSGIYEAFGSLTIQELARLIRFWYPDWDEDRYQQMVEVYEINVRQKLAHCSKGERKKVEFILALAHQPRLLLLDEPFTGVDMVSKRHMVQHLTQFLEHPEHSLLIATHQQDEIGALCDYIWLLDHGQLVGCYEKDQLAEHWARVWLEELPEELMGHPHVLHCERQPAQLVTDHLAQLRQLLDERGIEVLHIQRLELDEVLEWMLTSHQSRPS